MSRPGETVLLSDRINIILEQGHERWFTCAELVMRLKYDGHHYSSGSVGQALQYLWAKARVTKSGCDQARPARWRAWTGKAFAVYTETTGDSDGRSTGRASRAD